MPLCYPLSTLRCNAAKWPGHARYAISLCIVSESSLSGFFECTEDDYLFVHFFERLPFSLDVFSNPLFKNLSMGSKGSFVRKRPIIVY